MVPKEMWQWTHWLFYSLKDSGWRCFESRSSRMYHTKTSQVYMYQDIHTGPCHKVDEKFARILNITFVTMTFGLGLPILFPIALLALFVMYAVERYQIAYFYQMPPSTDDKMTKNALQMLSLAPLLFLMNGYWMLSNRQMFENVVSKVEFSTD